MALRLFQGLSGMSLKKKKSGEGFEPVNTLDSPRSPGVKNQKPLVVVETRRPIKTSAPIKIDRKQAPNLFETPSRMKPDGELESVPTIASPSIPRRTVSAPKPRAAATVSTPPERVSKVGEKRSRFGDIPTASDSGVVIDENEAEEDERELPTKKKVSVEEAPPKPSQHIPKSASKPLSWEQPPPRPDKVILTHLYVGSLIMVDIEKASFQYSATTGGGYTSIPIRVPVKDEGLSHVSLALKPADIKRIEVHNTDPLMVVLFPKRALDTYPSRRLELARFLNHSDTANELQRSIVMVFNSSHVKKMRDFVQFLTKDRGIPYSALTDDVQRMNYLSRDVQRGVTNVSDDKVISGPLPPVPQVNLGKQTRGSQMVTETRKPAPVSAPTTPASGGRKTNNSCASSGAYKPAARPRGPGDDGKESIDLDSEPFVSPTGYERRSNPQRTTRATAALVPDTIVDIERDFGPAVKSNDTVLVYPPPPEKDTVTLTVGDVRRLEAGEFLNDNLIAFWMRRLQLLMPSLQRPGVEPGFPTTEVNVEDCLFFNTFFFPKLKESYHNVKRWTKNVDIFSKKFIFIPINESFHWNMVVVINPDLLLNVAKKQQAARLKRMAAREAKLRKASETSTEEGTESTSTEVPAVDEDDDVPSEDTPKVVAAAKNSTKTTLVYLDSLNTDGGAVFLRTVRKYLIYELWDKKKIFYNTLKTDLQPMEGQKELVRIIQNDKDMAVDMPRLVVKPPQQETSCDCGVFLLRYMECFLTDPPNRPKEYADWKISPEEVQNTRKRMYNEILRMSKESIYQKKPILSEGTEENDSDFEEVHERNGPSTSTDEPAAATTTTTTTTSTTPAAESSSPPDVKEDEDPMDTQPTSKAEEREDDGEGEELEGPAPFVSQVDILDGSLLASDDATQSASPTIDDHSSAPFNLFSEPALHSSSEISSNMHGSQAGLSLHLDESSNSFPTDVAALPPPPTVEIEDSQPIVYPVKHTVSKALVIDDTEESGSPQHHIESSQSEQEMQPRKSAVKSASRPILKAITKTIVTDSDEEETEEKLHSNGPVSLENHHSARKSHPKSHKRIDFTGTLTPQSDPDTIKKHHAKRVVSEDDDDDDNGIALISPPRSGDVISYKRHAGGADHASHPHRSRK